MKQRFLRSGLDDFDDHQILELLLFYAIPQGDVNELGHLLLKEFGALAAVFDAPIEALLRIKGVGEHTALLIKLIPQIYRSYLISGQIEAQRSPRATKNAVIILNSTEKAGSFLLPYFHGARDELVYLVCLDAKRKVLDCRKMAHGEVNSANISPRKILAAALFCNATDVILAHNHTSGLAIPSPEDIRTTMQIRRALESVQIQLLDHLIIADDEFVSMEQSKML